MAEDVSEEWRLMLGGTYEVSSLGRVRRATDGRRTHAGRLMRPVVAGPGYLMVGPTVNGRNVQFYVHDLVSEAFLGERPPGATVNHIDGVKTNNRASNLEYVTHAENMAHASRMGLMARGESHPGSRFTEEDIRAIRARHAAGDSICGLARELRASTATIYNIVRRKAWGHVR